MKKSILSVLALAVLGLSSCEKDKDDDCALSDSAIVGTYKMVAWGNITSGVQTDMFATYLDACDRDDTYTLNADHTYVLTDAGMECSPAEHDTGTWMLSNGVLSISAITTDDITGDVQEFNCDGFKVSFIDMGGGTNSMTFQRQ